MRLGGGAGRLFELPLHKNGTSDAMSRETVTSGNDKNDSQRLNDALCSWALQKDFALQRSPR